MTEDRKFRFNDDRGMVVIPQDGSPPYRLDGEPLTQMDKDLIAGVDPIAMSTPEYLLPRKSAKEHKN